MNVNIPKITAIHFAKWIKKGEWDTCSWDENKWMRQEPQIIVNSIDELYEIFLEDFTKFKT